MTRRSLPILAAIAAALLAGLPSSAVRAQQVFLGDPVDSSGRPFPMIPGLPLGQSPSGHPARCSHSLAKDSGRAGKRCRLKSLSPCRGTGLSPAPETSR